MISNGTALRSIPKLNVRVLDTNDIATLPSESLELVCAPDPSTIPGNISDIDPEILRDNLYIEELKVIREKVDTMHTNDKKLFSY